MIMTMCHQQNALEYKWYKWKDRVTVGHQNNTNRNQMALNAVWRGKEWNRVARLKNTCNDKPNDKTNRPKTTVYKQIYMLQIKLTE